MAYRNIAENFNRLSRAHIRYRHTEERRHLRRHFAKNLAYTQLYALYILRLCWIEILLKSHRAVWMNNKGESTAAYTVLLALSFSGRTAWRTEASEYRN